LDRGWFGRRAARLLLRCRVRHRHHVARVGDPSARGARFHHARARRGVDRSATAVLRVRDQLLDHRRLLARPPPHLPLHQGLRPQATGHQPSVPDVDRADAVLGVAAWRVRFAPACGGCLLFAHDPHQPEHGLALVVRDQRPEAGRPRHRPRRDPVQLRENPLASPRLRARHRHLVLQHRRRILVLLLFFVRRVTALYARHRAG
jgi:hypothetical protein